MKWWKSFSKFSLSPHAEFERQEEDEKWVYNERNEPSWAVPENQDASRAHQQKSLNRKERRRQTSLFKKRKIKI